MFALSYGTNIRYRTFEVKLLSACSVIVDGLAFFCRSSHVDVNIDKKKKKNARPSTIKLHADGNLTSKVI
jgi:hypothetical protein